MAVGGWDGELGPGQRVAQHERGGLVERKGPVPVSAVRPRILSELADGAGRRVAGDDDTEAGFFKQSPRFEGEELLVDPVPDAAVDLLAASRSFDEDVFDRGRVLGRGRLEERDAVHPVRPVVVVEATREGDRQQRY